MRFVNPHKIRKRSRIEGSILKELREKLTSCPYNELGTIHGSLASFWKRHTKFKKFHKEDCEICKEATNLAGLVALVIEASQEDSVIITPCICSRCLKPVPDLCRCVMPG